jgi:hypothetical protein
LALLLRRQYEFPQCGINKGNFYFFLFILFSSVVPLRFLEAVWLN